MKRPLLSILIPTVPERFDALQKLVAELTAQNKNKKAEILYFGDNRLRTIGAKRNGLLQAARGHYVAFCDDDDKVSGNYIAAITGVAEKEIVDVISFRQSAIWDGQHSEVHFSIQNRNEAFKPGEITKRFPWHVCAWRREIAQEGVFKNVNWGEDAVWVAQVAGLARREANIPEILHYYEHGSGSLAH
jgi:glycosyltransferase involved in cell wall biosynthesis